MVWEEYGSKKSIITLWSVTVSVQTGGFQLISAHLCKPKITLNVGCVSKAASAEADSKANTTKSANKHSGLSLHIIHDRVMKGLIYSTSILYITVLLHIPTSLHVTLHRASQGTLWETHPSFSPFNKGQHFIWLWEKVCVSIISDSHSLNCHPSEDTWDSFWPRRPCLQWGCTWPKTGAPLCESSFIKPWIIPSINPECILSGNTGSNHCLNADSCVYMLEAPAELDLDGCFIHWDTREKKTAGGSGMATEVWGKVNV